LDLQRRLDLRQRPQGQTQPPRRPGQGHRHLAAGAVHDSASNVTSPALARLSAKLASPSYWPAYSRAATRNDPSRIPKSGTITRQVRVACSKKASRISASEAVSRKTPWPDTTALRAPTPASSSRQRPALSESVTSTGRA